MSLIKQILNDPENISDILENDVKTSGWFEKEHLHPQMLGVAESTVKSMANNMNEAKAELKKVLSDNNFDPTTEYMIGKAIKLLSWEL